jgi:hypothetical protein
MIFVLYRKVDREGKKEQVAWCGVRARPGKEEGGLSERVENPQAQESP